MDEYLDEPAKTYEQLLECFADWEADEVDATEVKLASNSGDEELAALFRAHDELTNRIGAHCRKKLEERSQPSVTATCTTCSKTCDVGQKCWWCGNE